MPIGTSEGTQHETDFDFHQSQMDQHDLTDQFNTPLTDEEDMVFSQEFASRKNDLYDYDLKGWFQQNQNNVNAVIGDDKQVHLTDEFKKPNHPTFSDESNYHGRSENPENPDSSKKFEGGHWEQLEDKSYTFTPGRTNLEHHTAQELLDYFKKNEKGNRLILPGQ